MKFHSKAPISSMFTKAQMNNILHDVIFVGSGVAKQVTF